MAVEASETGGEYALSSYQTPARRTLLSKYLPVEQGKTSPVLAEYFRIALAFTALGSLIRRVNDRKALQGPVLNRKAQRIILHSLLKRAMEMLRGIATQAQELHNQLKEKNALHAEQGELRRQLAEAESGVAEMKKNRDEDAKANAKVMAIFSTQEQQWKKERQRLKGEILKLRKELTDCMGRLDVGAGKRVFCLECKKKDLRIFELEGQVKEKDFLMAAVAEDGSMEQSELAQKLGEAEGLVDSLKEKLVRESDAHAEVLSRMQKLELELADATEALRRAEREASEMVESRKELEAQNETLLKEQAQVKQAVVDHEKITSTLLGRMELLKSENSELTEKLEAIYGGTNGRTDDLHAKKKYFNRSRSTKLPGEGELHDLYMNQIGELENQVSYYQERLLQLEESALLRLDRYTGEQHITFEGDEAAEVLAVGYLEQSKELQLMAAKSLLAQYIESERARELELNKWRKLYAASKIALSMAESGNSCVAPPPTKDTGVREMVEAAKAQQAAELAERHWYEIETFERHMRAKDERMEALRMHLVSLEKQVKTRDSELAELRRCLDAETGSRAEAEARLRETQQELKACLEQELKVASSSTACTVPNAKKKRSRNMNGSSIRDALDSRDAELHSKDLKLAFMEAKLVQVQMQYDNERKSRERLIAEVLKEKQMLESLVKDSAGEGTQASSIKNAIATACLEVEKLSERIAEAREQIMQTGTQQNGRPLEDFMQQATEVSASGKALKKIQGLLFTKRDEEQSALVTKTPDHDQSETVPSDELQNGSTILQSQSETLVRTTYAPILMKEQLQRYQSLFQRMNELSAHAEAAMSNGSTLTPHLHRAVELQKEVNSSGRNLSVIAAEDHVGLQGPQLLRQHLTEIQKRLELKIGNMVNELRARADVSFQRAHRAFRVRRSSNTSARVLLRNQSQQSSDVSR